MNEVIIISLYVLEVVGAFFFFAGVIVCAFISARLRMSRLINLNRFLNLKDKEKKQLKKCLYWILVGMILLVISSGMLNLKLNGKFGWF